MIELFILFFLFLFRERLLNFFLNRNWTQIDLICWFIIKTFILVSFIYFFDIILHTLKEDMNIFMHFFLYIKKDIEGRDAYNEYRFSDEIIKEYERILSRIKDNSEFNYRRPFYNTLLIILLLHRDFTFFNSYNKNNKNNKKKKK